MIVGLVSTFREGRLAVDAVRSLLFCCDRVVVADGPIGDNPPDGIASDWTMFAKDQRVTIHVSKFGQQTHGTYTDAVWESDADKRTWLLEKTRRYPAPTWGVILDGDELLMYGEQIPALIEHHEQEAKAEGRESFGATLRLMEGDGTCGLIMGRVLRLDLIERWLISSYHIQLRTGMEVSRPNAYLLTAGQPDMAAVEPSTGMQIRRPLQGEPHILHRSWFRAASRTAERQSSAEGSAFDNLVQTAGLLEVHGERPADDRFGIWTPK